MRIYFVQEVDTNSACMAVNIYEIGIKERLMPPVSWIRDLKKLGVALIESTSK
jgi:hypothetical protein